MTNTEAKSLECKLTDFGFASVLDENHMFKDSLGSPNYMAPELIKKESYTEKVDIWATGCVFYSMLSGLMAFDGDTKKELHTSICTELPDMRSGIWKRVGKNCKKFIALMLERDWKKRPTAE
jgi:serine/threonine protein kinase